jgi:hypothetical protein
VSPRKSYRHTVPGALTAIAGVITALSGFIVALHQIGVVGREDKRGVGDETQTVGALVAWPSPTRPASARLLADVKPGRVPAYRGTRPLR